MRSCIDALGEYEIPGKCADSKEVSRFCRLQILQAEYYTSFVCFHVLQFCCLFFKYAMVVDSWSFPFILGKIGNFSIVSKDAEQ